MHDRIQDVLASVEAEHGVRILYACESGSRGWGFESRDSDWDVRFIYAHPLDWYLSIEPQRDVIELPISEALDVSGWELRKSLGLLLRSNPVLHEWLSSPIVYREAPEAMRQFRELAARLNRPVTSFHHYLHMARGNFRDYLKGERVWLKKYLYVLRPVLACLWIERNAGAPPMSFSTLVEAVVADAELLDAINELVQRKKAGDELDEGPCIPVIQAFLDEQLPRLHEAAVRMPKEPHPLGTREELDAYFRDCLRQG